MRRLELNNSGPKISLADVSGLEKKIEIKMPPEFIDFLLATNGGEKDYVYKPNQYKEKFSVRYFLGIKSEMSIEETFLAIKEIFDSKDWLPFGMDVGDWIYCISLKNVSFGKVYLMRTDEADEEKAFKYVSNNFNDFIEGLETK